MTIQTGVPNSLRRPQTFHTYNIQRVAGSLVNVPLRIVLIGAQSSAATATVNTVNDLSGMTPTQVDALYGVSTELALMYREANACAVLFQRGPRIFAVGIAESGGVANVQTITAVGTASTDGNQRIKVAGRVFDVGIRSGDVQNTIATKISNALKGRQAELPVTVSVAANVVTLTHPTKGINGVDVRVSVDAQVAGCVLTVATGTAGTGATDHQPALNVLSPLRYDGIVFANHAAADITEINTDISTRWSSASKAWGWYFLGEMGTIGTATALSAAANFKGVVVATFEGCLNTAGEIATATAMLVWSRERVNASYDGARVPLYPPAIGTIYDGTEVETAIAAGLTAYTAVIDSTGAVTQNLAKCERLITTKTTTDGQPDDTQADIGIPRTTVGLSIQIDIETPRRFGSESNPDGVRQNSTTAARIKDMVAAIWRAAALDEIINQDFVEADIAQTLVEADGVTPGRNNVALYYHPVGSQHQIVWQHNVTVGA